MKLVELVEYLLGPKRLEQLVLELNLDTESESLLIYMKEKLSLDSDIEILPIELTDDNINHQYKGIEYIQLFPLDMAVELIENDLELKGKGLSHQAIAERLVHYRIYDA